MARQPLFLDLCDRLLSMLPAFFGMTGTEIQRRLGGDFPGLALERLVAEGLADVDAREGQRRYRFAFGANWAWGALLYELETALAESGRGWTIEELARRQWSRPRWLVRALYRLWRQGRLERMKDGAYVVAAGLRRQIS